MEFFFLNLHAQVMAAKDSADYKVLVSSTDTDGTNSSTIADLPIDENLGPALRLIAQSYRMGARFGNAEPGKEEKS